MSKLGWLLLACLTGAGIALLFPSWEVSAWRVGVAVGILALLAYAFLKAIRNEVMKALDARYLELRKMVEWAREHAELRERHDEDELDPMQGPFGTQDDDAI